MNDSKLKMTGKIEVTLRDKNGNIKYHDVQKNLVVKQGLANAMRVLFGTGGTTIKALGIAWYSTTPSPPVYTDTEFPTGNRLGQSRLTAADNPGASFSISEISTPGVNTSTFKVQASWGVGVPSATTINITAIGLFTAGGVGTTDLFCWKDRTPIGKDPADVLEVNYEVTISG